MNVAEQYPARTDGNGVTWYRPRRAAGISMAQWGWTALRERAHEDYKLLHTPSATVENSNDCAIE